MYKLAVIKVINHGDLMYKIMTVVNKTVLHMWKLLIVNLKSSQQKKKIVIKHSDGC